MITVDIDSAGRKDDVNIALEIDTGVDKIDVSTIVIVEGPVATVAAKEEDDSFPMSRCFGRVAPIPTVYDLLKWEELWT